MIEFERPGIFIGPFRVRNKSIFGKGTTLFVFVCLFLWVCLKKKKSKCAYEVESTHFD